MQCSIFKITSYWLAQDEIPVIFLLFLILYTGLNQTGFCCDMYMVCLPQVLASMLEKEHEASCRSWVTFFPFTSFAFTYKLPIVG
jgi:hypothetical protein